MLTGANPLSSRAQNCNFCALLAFGTPVFQLPEHKNGVFVRFWGLEPLFSSISSTKSGFLCQNGRFSPCFRAVRAQNCHFCARVIGDVGLEVVNVGFGKRKARMFWVCALLLICLAARSAALPGVPPTTCWPGNEEPGHEGPGNESRGTKGLGTKGRRVYWRQRLRKCWCIVVSWLSSGWKAVTSWLPCCAATIFPSTVASTFTPSPTSLM